MLYSIAPDARKGGKLKQKRVGKGRSRAGVDCASALRKGPDHSPTEKCRCLGHRWKRREGRDAANEAAEAERQSDPFQPTVTPARELPPQGSIGCDQ